MPELIAPAGCFTTAIHAFNAGADSIYLGLKNFSARKSAQNFTFDQLKKLKIFAIENNKKIYTAINTIIKEDELPQLFDTLYFLEKIQVNGIIIQDMGIYEIIKKYFPALEIHASTQLAVHNDYGVKQLKELGFKRIVLARELSFEKIKQIREKNPDIELEVFIHGALCYSFSGLCLASGMILNRSSNRGECAQLCRSFYEIDNKNSYCFSCNDLSLENNILKLKNIGINSFKIEGRMKSPEYVFNTVKLYNQILKNNAPLVSEQINKLKKDIHLSFSRNETTGYFSCSNGENLIDSNYQTHQGVKIGEVLSITKNSFTLKTKHNLCLRDGLMFFIKNDLFKPYKFSIKKNDLKKQSCKFL
ncbi:U32 family peptidase [bacterium]|nr:U32 family peptidase [bacterium]